MINNEESKKYILDIYPEKAPRYGLYMIVMMGFLILLIDSSL